MTPIPIAVNRTPATCPDCGSALSMPLGSKARPGMVVQTCKNLQHCGRSVWSSAAEIVTEPVVDDGSRHGRFQLPATSEPAPPAVVAPNRWASMGRMARIARLSRRELEALNQQDRRLAAAGGDR